MEQKRNVYAILHGQVMDAALIAVNTVLGIAYVKIEGYTQRVAPECIFETYHAAAKRLAMI